MKASDSDRCRSEVERCSGSGVSRSGLPKMPPRSNGRLLATRAQHVEAEKHKAQTQTQCSLDKSSRRVVGWDPGSAHSTSITTP